MLRVGHDGDATMPYLIQQEGNVSGACHCLGPVDGRDSRWVHLVRSRIPVWLMTRLEDADETGLRLRSARWGSTTSTDGLVGLPVVAGSDDGESWPWHGA